MSLPTPTTSAAALLAQAQARFQASVARTATAVAVARARVSDDSTSADALAALETELRRVQGWAASFGLRELKQQSGQLARRVRRWADDPAFERAERVAVLGAEAKRLAVLATERPAWTPRVTAPPAAPAVAPAVAPLPQPGPPAPAEVPAASSRAPVPAPDAVVVQGEARMARLLMFALEQAGLSVSAFDSGVAALEALRDMHVGTRRPLVILDVELPGLDGHDVHETLRAERPGAFAFVFTAAPNSDGEWMRATKAGALDYVMRPVSLRTLLTKIPQWLSASATPTAAGAELRPPRVEAEETLDAPAFDSSPEPPEPDLPPALEAPADAPVTTLVRGALGGAPDVVLVEDDPGMRRLLMFGLEQSGLRVTAFDSGVAALDALRRMPAAPERPLVLLDVELPGLDGHAVHESLRAERPGVFSFVFVSGRLSEGEQMRAINAGALDYVTKPVSLRVLMAKIPRWLAAGAGRAASPAESRRPVIIPRRRAGVA